MKIELSFTEIQQAIADLQRNYDNQLQLESNEVFLTLPPSLGNGYLRGIRLREGLDLCVQEFVLKQDVSLNNENLLVQGSYSSLTFCIAGQFNGTLTDIYPSLTIRAQDAVFCTNPYGAGTVEYKAGEHIHFVDITLAPNLMLSLIKDELNELPQNFQKVIQSGASQPSVHFCDTSAETSQVLHKIIHCPYHGKIRSVYLEGKVLELVALYFSQFCSPSNPLLSASFRPQDIDQLHKGREILKQNLIAPPSLAELSEQVGLSERRLQQGFRELFGTTVFGVLHNDRMERARQLLEARQISIGAIANIVGISHRGYFAKAFKRKFGCTPKEYIKKCT